MNSQDSGAGESVQPRLIDTSTPHPARRYNYWLGGKDNYEADRASGDAIAAMMPSVRVGALENRAFMRRAVSFLAHAGIRQFLDIGTGIPAPNNTHEVAQRIAPDSRVVYVDNDPIVMSHARALLTSDPRGATAYIEADIRDSSKILTHSDLQQTLDLTQPTALLLVAILHFLPDDAEAHAVLRRLVEALPKGSYVVVSHATHDFLPENRKAEVVALAASGRQGPFRFRTKEEFSRFFTGLEMISPGIVSATDWRSDQEPEPRPVAADAGIYGAVALVT